MLLEHGVEKLLADQHREVAHDQDAIALKPDWRRYELLEKTDGFLAFGVWKERELVGYSAFFLNRSLHYSDHVFALNDVIYLKPAYRGALGLRLIAHTENHLKGLGASKIFYHTKNVVLGADDQDSLSALESMLEAEKELGQKLPDSAFMARTLAEVLAGLGYSHQETVMGKMI